MTEYQKMIAGEFYNALDPELTRMRAEARALLTQINQSIQDIREGERLELCRRLFGKTGKGLWLQPPFYCDYGKNIELGENVYFNFNCVILDVAKVIIGSNVFCGPNVQFYTAGHPLDPHQRRQGLEFGKTIRIGNDVWIGGNTVLCPGVSIEDRCVIGAGSVVTKNIPADCVAAGNPARILKKLTHGS